MLTRCIASSGAFGIRGLVIQRVLESKTLEADPLIH
jgi:hypothetical protein